MTLRDEIVKAARWGVANHKHFTYSEGPERMEAVHKPYQLPIISDCSSWVTSCYSWAGAPDPNGLNYNGTGYTGTLLSHGERIPLSEVQPGDIIVYGPGTGWHTAIVVQPGQDPLTVSMGQNGDPSFVRVSQDGRQPQTYLRFIPADPKPATHGSMKPTLKQVVKAIGKKHSVFKFKNIAAVKAWQKSHGLVPDGIVGPLTLAKLHELGLM
jgi:hypothetical protein